MKIINELIENTILYNDRVKYRDQEGIVRNVQGAVSEVLFDGNKKTTKVTTASLEKIK